MYLDSYNAYRASHGGQAWTQRAIGTTGGDGSYTFSAWPTTLSADGEKYRIRIQNVDGTQVAIMDNITLSNDVSGGNYTVTTSQLSSPYITGFKVPTGTHQRGEQVEVSVTVKNSSDAARSFWVRCSLKSARTSANTSCASR